MKYILILVTFIIFSFLAVTSYSHEGHFVEIEGVRYEMGTNHLYAIVYKHPNHKFVAHTYPVREYADIRQRSDNPQYTELVTQSGEIGHLGKINWTKDVLASSPTYEQYLKSVNDFSVGFLLNNNSQLYISTGLMGRDSSFAQSKLGIQLLENNIQDIQIDSAGNFLIISPTKTTVVTQSIISQITSIIYETQLPIDEKVTQIKSVLSLHSGSPTNTVEPNEETFVSVTPEPQVTESTVDQSEEIQKLKKEVTLLEKKVEKQEEKLSGFEAWLKQISTFLSNIFG